ncbi:cytochrome c oxidase accessory protein CcoG [Novosphingobium panipatense]|jgi:cytochrome c oxidase accessory protein FixG|uniref:cytochrome c oxidase accessory protein CcoG n=1 Tax=Novosphingobium TaxID=165696 RepID=UPI000CDB5573|nr:cytochrome c oxidase accessory protein CcoG [Novosphingobium sp. HII-3]
MDQSTASGSTRASLYARHEPVFNRRIDGKFRRIKWAVMALCLIVYWVTPWLRWDRGSYAPDQAVLIDLAHRRFYMFGIEIWPHEFYFVAGLLIMAGIGLFLVTSAVGRAWCGYACPQTVWTDLFQHVDRLIDGDRNARMRLHKAPWGPAKIARRLVKWSIYLVISFATGGAWIFYFADAPTLQHAFWTGTADPVAYATVAVLTATTFVLGGFLREQVCIYMCPWPRIQTTMLDEKSLIVTYKDWRGEPRASVKKAQKAPDLYGDCIDCAQCVAVCPTGIDIREGAQVGCITCALCIDACDRVMKEVGRPRGLIDYATLEDAEAEQAGHAPTRHRKLIWRPRTLVYVGAWAGIGFALLFLLGARVHTDLTVSKDRNPPYILLSDGSVRNAYTLRLRNMQGRPRRMEIALDGLAGAEMWADDSRRAAAGRRIVRTVPADATYPLRIYVVAPQATSGQDFVFRLRALGEPDEMDTAEVRFDTPQEATP